jgi:protein-L-isoaspartate(D-aspartate) O-methyltransferase
VKDQLAEFESWRMKDRFLQSRRRMVHDQLRARKITDPRVLAAMASVPREQFVGPAHRGAAYDDCPLPIGLGQTISQPFTVAFMMQQARLRGHETVLEVGTGSGYGAAVLARLAKRVFTLERLPELAERARSVLGRLGVDNVQVCVADGTLGWPPGEPYDAILVTAGGAKLPAAFASQLNEGGRVVIPLGSAPTSQRMKRFTRRLGQMHEEDFGGFAFVPLIGADGWDESKAKP